MEFSLYVLGFEISCSRVCVLGFGSSASLVLGMGCARGQGVLEVCMFFRFPLCLSDILFTAFCTFNAVD